MNEYTSEFWEHLCREAVSGNEILGQVWGEARRWWGSVKTDDKIRQIEIDLIAQSADGKSIMIGECKWTNPEIAVNLAKDLKEKSLLLPFCNGKQILPVLFLKNKPKDMWEANGINILYPEDIIRLSYG